MIAPREVALRDGRRVRIRGVGPEDAAGLIALDEAVIRDGRGVVMGVEDLEANAASMPERLRAWCERPARDGGGMIVAEEAGRLVGEAMLRRMEPARLRHTAGAALQVHPDRQRLGLGRALMDALLEAAASMAWLRRLELTVRADNDRAIALYAALGFVEEGRRRAFVQRLDGAFVDDLILVHRGVAR